MIVKYLKDGVWGYIDNVRQCAHKSIDQDELITRYNKEVEKGERDDIASYMDGTQLPQDVALSNKIFLMSTENFDVENAINIHRENLIALEKTMQNYPASVVLMYVEENKDYDAIVFVTNQTVYLMNDKGQTIERLV